MKEQEKKVTGPHNLVVIGSSAGGIEALSILLETVPDDFPAPIVLAQHLDPTRPSSLDQILQKHTSLPVEAVTTNRVLQAGKIYVLPANIHTSIKDHYIEVKDDSLSRPQPSIDTLLSTAAQAYGEHLIAVILTGSGSDGTAGAIDVKNAGGIIIIQNPQKARYPSMPLSLPPTIVDYDLDVEHIGPLLYELLTKTDITPAEEKVEDRLRNILEQVSLQASIDFRRYKTSTILRRISRRMVVTHNANMGDYAEYLKMYPEEVGELVNAFLINVTQFFRDIEAFAYLNSEILPRLIAQARGRDHVLRFWTAGCATGEEPYSLAMLLTNLLGAEMSQWSIKIFATDLDDAAIHFARRGTYTETLLKGVPNEYRDRFFERVEQGYRISKTLRQMVIFGQQDLSRSAPFPRIDLVLCRNVLIYFTPELQDTVLNQFAYSLYPNGYLFLGKAETVRPVQAFYELVNKQWKVYRCIGSALPLGYRQHFADVDIPRVEILHMKSKIRAINKVDADNIQSDPLLEISHIRHFNEVSLRFLNVGIVVIDRAYHIVTANGAARRLLGLREIGIDQDFLHAVRGVPYHQVRIAIDTVFRERSPINLTEVELESVVAENGRYLNLSLALMQIDAGLPDLTLISVTDVTQQVQIRHQLETIQTEQRKLMNELGTANKHLSDMNKELMETNEGLQVANEELVLTHEELQASIEEFETTNEELQATNEELETNNEELQATNEELETTNDELRTRTNELQELATLLENERGRLAKTVELAPFYILVLRGPNLIVEAYNPHYARSIENRPVLGQPLDKVIDLFWDMGLEILHLARDTYRLDVPLDRNGVLTAFLKHNWNKEQTKAYFTYTSVPSHDTSDKVDGVVIYALDETEKHLREEVEEHKRMKVIFNNLSTVALALYDAQTAHLMMGSARYLEWVASVHHLKPDELVGRSWHELTLVPSQELASQIWQKALQNQTATHITDLSWEVRPRKMMVWSNTLTPILDADEPGRVRFILVSAVDTTEQVQMDMSSSPKNQS